MPLLSKKCCKFIYNVRDRGKKSGIKLCLVFFLESLNIVKSIKFLLTIHSVLVSLFSLIRLNENLGEKNLSLSYTTVDFKMNTRLGKEM